MKEVDDLREARERQKEMVSAIVKQRDMYRTLLAQSTPLPGETTLDTQPSPRSGKLASAGIPPGGEGAEHVTMATTPSQVDVETVQALKELKEQFATYKREKRENDGITGQQVEQLRQEASALRMDNVKMAAKVVWVWMCVCVCLCVRTGVCCMSTYAVYE